LLPQYRGAAPINWAIINGEKETGVTTFFLTHEIDTGKIILQEKIPILPSDNAGTLHDKLMMLGASTVKKTVDLIISDAVQPIDQSELLKNTIELRSAPKIFRENCEIDVSWDVERAHNFVRGLSPYPGAWMNLVFPHTDEKTVLKIFQAEKEFSSHQLPLGSLETDGKKFAKIALKDGFLVLKEVQAPNKKRMEIGEFLRGLR